MFDFDQILGRDKFPPLSFPPVHLQLRMSPQQKSNNTPTNYCTATGNEPLQQWFTIFFDYKNSGNWK